jgi:hypothetical protein
LVLATRLDTVNRAGEAIRREKIRALWVAGNSKALSDPQEPDILCITSAIRVERVVIAS